MSSGYRVPFHNRVIRRALRPVFRLVFRLLGPVKITGKENIPQNGGYLIAINHISYFEAPLVAAFWPVAPEAAGAVEIWSRPGQAQLVRLYGGIPVHRGEYDRRLLDKMLAALQAGRPLMIAPEGGRSHTPGLRRGLPGVAYVADRAGVPVVPVGVIGTTRDYFDRAIHRQRPPLELRIGTPLHLPRVEGRGALRRTALQANVDQVMLQLAALLPPDYRGVYASGVPDETQ